MCDVDQLVQEFLERVSNPLTPQVKLMVDQAALEIKQRYAHGAHQLVAMGMDEDGNTFVGIQHDGISAASTMCAEPFVVHEFALRRAKLVVIVVAHQKRADQGGGIHIVTPCGTCCEMLRQFFPDCLVVPYFKEDGLRMLPIKAILTKMYKTRIPGANGEAARNLFEDDPQLEKESS